MGKTGKDAGRGAGGGEQHSRGLVIIGVYKIVEGVLLLAVGIGVLRLLHKDVAEEVTHWVNFLRVDPDNVFIHRILKRLAIVNDKSLKEFGIGTFIYSGLRFTEGIGLVLRQTWAEYFTVIVTAALIPLEIFELVKKATPVKAGLLAVNVAIVVYLIWELKRSRAK
ncbi:MAG: DUF2127 domain-containing protein [Candidatus Acidiferrum sp.]